MPRARRTKSAVHEALQRRVDERPGDSFTAKLAGGERCCLVSQRTLCVWSFAILFKASLVARPAIAFMLLRQNERSSSPTPPDRLDDHSL